MVENRIRTNAEIDTLNQFLNEGETPLPYEGVEKITPQEENQTPEPTADSAKETKEEKEIVPEVAPIEAELDDEKVLAYLKNKKGKDVASLDEFINPKKELTEEEKQAAISQRESNKYAYGLTKGLFNKGDLDKFIKDTNNPKDLVFDLYKKDQKEKDPDLSDAEIEAEFDEKFGLDTDESSRQYKAGQNLINRIANDIITQRHSKILSLDKEYDSFEATQSKQKETEQKILQQAPLYKKDVDEVKGSIKKISVPVGENEVFEMELDEENVNDIIAPFLETNYSSQQIQGGWNKETLTQTANTFAVMKNLPKLMNEYANKKLLEKQSGIRGVQPQGRQGERGLPVKELSEDQKKALAFAFPEKQSEPIAN